MVRNGSTYRNNKDKALALADFFASVCKLPHMKQAIFFISHRLFVLDMMTNAYSVLILL